MKGFRLLLAILSTGLLATPALAETDRLAVPAMRYDRDYPSIDYSGPARDNRVWRMQQKISRGELKLQWEPRFGYLRSLLKALEIDPSTQTLVFSKTSLQTQHISEQTPRALYFNDDVYVGYIHGSDFMEIAAVDDKRGVVFYGFSNRPDASQLPDREGGRCLTCHDTYSMMGGGVPRVMVLSAPVADAADERSAAAGAIDVDDRTPIAQRWGGWYLSGWYLPGKDGKPVQHLGNLPLRTESRTDDGATIRSLAHTRDNRGNVVGYFDTDRYLTDKSDVAALLVMEHQTLVQNLITRASYKVHTIVPEVAGKGASVKRWEDLSARQQTELKPVVEPLVRALFFADAVPLTGQVISSSGFPERFTKPGPRDAEGRSLRDLKLDGSLFRYRLSYMIYTDSFKALPAYVRDYVERRIVEVLQGRDTTGISLPAEEREAIGQILAMTQPQFASRLGTTVAAR